MIFCWIGGQRLEMENQKKRIIFVYNNLGIGGIAKSLITTLSLIDYTRYDVTLYIRRDDVLDLIDEVPPHVHTVLINNEVKSRVFENNIKGKIVKLIYNALNRHHKHLAKEFFIAYKYPLQRKNEKKTLDSNNEKWDVAISYSTDGDDPIFVNECIKSEKKYVFVHQSTEIAKRNIKAMEKFDGIISVNPVLVSWISSMVNNQSKVLAIENYVDYHRIIQLASEKIDFPYTNRTVFATCGRLCTTKGYDYVVEIASQLKEKNVDFVWYWVGDGPQRSDMERIVCEKGLNDYIVITGFQNNPYPYMGNCDVYIQPSRAEMYPLTLLEALVLRKPIISTNTAGGKYILTKHNCGFLAENPTKDILGVLIKLLSNQNKLIDEQEKTALIDWESDRQRYLIQLDHLLSGVIE